MTLPHDWFEESYSRIERWDVNGLSLLEVEIALETYLTDNNPISLEIADYVAENWTCRRIRMLNAESRRTLLKIWDERDVVTEASPEVALV
ncbi:hypothetical protein LNL84_07120 [Vibrio sp. ZSDZ34]|jgi:hypothetical protein|uniref:Uncharacterized protein n=1 Tax=Vibrio gelatinilyticus TaxID=2893468 RepID=A0A9X1WDX7_9VIBR|nr:hypothetical protein [Vibrio gelatinilyticus]MCJ2376605.1 hypothetical protein [Vibrio gelatinilyticus]